MSDASQAILADTDNGVTTITLNRVDKKNSITSAMYAAMADALEAASADAAVRVGQRGLQFNCVQTEVQRLLWPPLLPNRVSKVEPGQGVTRMVPRHFAQLLLGLG